MNEMTIRLERNGAAAVPGGQLLLGYAGNRGQLPAAHRAAGRVEGADRVRPLAHPRRKRGYAGGKRNPDRTGGGDGSARRGLPHL